MPWREKIHKKIFGFRERTVASQLGTCSALAGVFHAKQPVNPSQFCAPLALVANHLVLDPPTRLLDPGRATYTVLNDATASLSDG